jgi:plasma kallikrein
VLTAAHCVYKKMDSNLRVRAGEWDSQTTDEIFAHEERQVLSIKLHEHFESKNLLNDVALLFLAGEPLALTNAINTVCLPPQNYDSDNQRCLASGWGKTIFGKFGEYSVILKKVELPIVPHAQCQTNMRATRLGASFILHESFLCAGGEEGKDMCVGDGGAPLVCPIEPGSTERYYQTGIVAWVSESFVRFLFDLFYYNKLCYSRVSDAEKGTFLACTAKFHTSETGLTSNSMTEVMTKSFTRQTEF